MFHRYAHHTHRQPLDVFDDTVQSMSKPCGDVLLQSSIVHQVLKHLSGQHRVTHHGVSDDLLFFIQPVSVSGATPNKRCMPRKLPLSR